MENKFWMPKDKIFRFLKTFFVFVILFNFQTSTNSKPVPPGAGEGDVAANILFLVDSSASMGAWIGNDGLDSVPNAVYDSAGRIIVTQARGQGVVRDILQPGYEIEVLVPMVQLEMLEGVIR